MVIDLWWNDGVVIVGVVLVISEIFCEFICCVVGGLYEFELLTIR